MDVKISLNSQTLFGSFPRWPGNLGTSRKAAESSGYVKISWICEIDPRVKKQMSLSKNARMIKKMKRDPFSL